MINESHKEDRESGSNAKPEGHRDHGEANDHPPVIKMSPRNRGSLFHHKIKFDIKILYLKCLKQAGLPFPQKQKPFPFYLIYLSSVNQ